MSHEIVKSISIQKDKVFLTSADSSIRPLYYHRWECISLSKLLCEKGRAALLACIGEEVWNGNMHLRRGSKLCSLFLDARSAFPREMHFSNFDSKTAGVLLGEMVSALEHDTHADLTPFISRALEKRNDRDYILDAAVRTGHNYLNYASEDIQKDRAFALDVLRAGQGKPWFDYPKQFSGDKAFALEALRLNGCYYRDLSDQLKADKDIIFFAFEESPDRKYHEHLPDLIPPAVYVSFNDEQQQHELDSAFFCKLLDLCPSMHMSRTPYLLAKREISHKWAQVGSFFPYSFSELPRDFQTDTEFQQTLIKRFENTDHYDALVTRFQQAGLTMPKPGFDSQVRAASSRAATTLAPARTTEQTPEL